MLPPNMNKLAYMTEDDYRFVAKDLFVNLDMIRAMEADYAYAINAFREVYNAGRARGAYEADPTTG